MVNIEFKELIIDQISNSSGVFSGDNLLVNWKAFIKDNSGYGTLSGVGNKCINNNSKVIKNEIQPQDDGYDAGR